MVTIEILEGKTLAIDWHDSRVVITTQGMGVEYAWLEISKPQAETLAAVLLVMAKQLD